MLIGRTLGPRLQGIYATTVLIWTFGSAITGLGIGVTNVTFAGQHPPGDLLSNSVWFVLYSTLLASIGILVIELGLTPASFGDLPAEQVKIALGAIPIGVGVAALGGLMWGLNRMREWNLIFVLLVPLVSLVAAFILVARLRMGMPGAIAAWLMGQVVALVVGARQLLAGTSFRLHWDSGLAGETLWYGLRANLAQLIGQFNFRLDAFFVLYFLGARAVGLYSIAAYVAEWLFFLPSATATVLFPGFASSDAATAAGNANRAMRLTVITTTAAMLGLAVCAPWIIRMFGPAYRDAVGPLLVLLPGVGVYSLAHITTVYWYGFARKPQINLLIAGVSLAVDIGGVMFLVPRFGLIGAALASTIAYVVAMTLNIFLYARHSGSPARAMLLPTRSDLVALRTLALQQSARFWFFA